MQIYQVGHGVEAHFNIVDQQSSLVAKVVWHLHVAPGYIRPVITVTSMSSIIIERVVLLHFVATDDMYQPGDVQGGVAIINKVFFAAVEFPLAAHDISGFTVCVIKSKDS